MALRQALKTGVPQAYRESSNRSLTVYGTKAHPLDSEDAQERLKKLQSYRRQARIAQAENRSEMAIDEDYYDGIQFDPEDLAILQNRNQPPLVFNVTKNTVNFLLGTERKARIDSRVMPRKKKGAQSARSKTKLMKYTQDLSKGEYERSWAFADCVKAGLGWLETGIKSADGYGDQIYMRRETWRNMWFDHLGHSLDGSDWRFMLREKWVDLDVIQELFPERAEQLRVLADKVNSLFPYLPDDVTITDTASEWDTESSLEALFSGPFDGSRQRVKAVECWYRMPARVKVLRQEDESVPFGVLDGVIYRDSADQKYLVQGGYFSLIDAVMMVMHRAIWAGSTFLIDGLSPYNHNKFPFTPIFCYRRQRDNMPYGVVRDMRDPQSDLNKRRSRSLFLLSANRVLYEKGAFDDPVKAYEEINRPDGMVEYNVGKKMEINKEIQEFVHQNEMARDDERFIGNISGVTPEAKGQSTRDLSGVAIGKLQLQSTTTSGVFFDNYYYSLQGEGEIRLALIEQSIDQEEEFRITGDQRKDEFFRVNEAKGGRIFNSITEAKADFVMGKQDYRETLRLAMFTMLSDLVTALSQSMPQVALAMLDEVVDYMDDLPNKDELVARIRKINGQQGPDDELTPEEKQARAQEQQQAAQKQQMLEQIQQALAQLQVANEQAKVTSTEAKALKDQIGAQMAKLDGFLKALQVASQIQAAPQLVEGADKLMEEAEKAGGPPQTGG